MKSPEYDILSALSVARAEILQSVHGIDGGTFERAEIISAIEGLSDNMEEISRLVEYLCLPKKSGILRKNARGRFFLVCPDGEELPDLTCGAPLEIFSDEEWWIGRVEHRSGEYYFYGHGKPDLQDGMIARVRAQSQP